MPQVLPLYFRGQPALLGKTRCFQIDAARPASARGNYVFKAGGFCAVWEHSLKSAAARARTLAKVREALQEDDAVPRKAKSVPLDTGEIFDGGRPQPALMAPRRKIFSVKYPFDVGFR